MFGNLISAENKPIVDDWVNVGTMLVVSRLLASGSLTDNKWLMESLYTLLGFTAYHIVTKRVLKVQVSNAVMQNVVNDTLKVGTMLVVSRLLAGGSVTDEDWIMSSVYTLLGFAAYQVVVANVVPFEKVENGTLRNAVQNSAKVGTMMIVSRLLAGGSIQDEKWMTSSAYTLLGFAAHDLVVKGLLN